MPSLTAANSVYMLSIPGLFTTPQQIQGFAADDAFTTGVLKAAETMMGVDGFLSGGFVYVEIVQSITLQADSASNALFDTWLRAQQNAVDSLTANGIIALPSLGKKFTATKGFLTGYPPMPDVKKLLQPRKFEITWESILPANTVLIPAN